MTKKNSIVIFAPDNDDPQAACVASWIKDMGYFPVYLPVVMPPEKKYRYFLDDRTFIWRDFNISAVKAVYLRSLTLSMSSMLPGYVSESDWAYYRYRMMIENEQQSFAGSFLTQLAEHGALIVNSPVVYLEHASKMSMYLKLKAHGFLVPETIMTADPAIAKSFSDTGPVVAKPAGIGSTREVRDDETSNFEEIKRAPVMFQRKISGSTIRCHVVGNKAVLSLRIESDFLDSRTKPSRFYIHDLTAKQEKTVVKATHFLGAHFAAWDLIIDNDGDLYLLDFNPGPYLWWIGEEAAGAVLRELARLLVVYAETQNLKKAYNAVKRCEVAFRDWGKANEVIQSVIDYNEKTRKERLRLRW